MSASVLITRAREDGLLLAERLKEHQVEAVIEPLLRIEPLPLTEKIPAPDILIATSRHALSAHYNCLLIVTGEGSATKARALGFADITVLDSASQIADYICKHYPVPRSILYLSGRDVTIDIAQELSAEGYDAKRLVTYIAHASAEFSGGAIKHMKARNLQAVLFFSTRSALIYEALVAKHALGEYQNSIEAFCLSAEIAAAAKCIPFARIHAAQKTDTQALLDDVISRLQRI